MRKTPGSEQGMRIRTGIPSQTAMTEKDSNVAVLVRLVQVILLTKGQQTEN